MYESEVRRRLPEMYKRLWLFAHKLTRNSADADDLTQATCLKALVLERGFNPGTDLWAWLCAVMQSVRKDGIRSRVHDDMRIVRYVHEVPLLPYVPADTNAVVQDVEKALGRLTATHRLLIIEARIKDRGQRELARELGRAPATVCAALRLATEQLEAALA